MTTNLDAPVPGSPQDIAELAARYINALQQKRQHYDRLRRQPMQSLKNHCANIGLPLRKSKEGLVLSILAHTYGAGIEDLERQLHDCGVDTKRLEQVQLFGAIR